MPSFLGQKKQDRVYKITTWRQPPVWLWWGILILDVYPMIGYMRDLSEPFSEWTGKYVATYQPLVIVTALLVFFGINVIIAQRKNFVLVSSIVLFTYLQMAVNFAMIYAENYAADHGCFRGVIHSPLDFLYFSITTLSTTGYGDIAAVTTSMRMVVSAEIVCGVVWTAISLGFIVNAIVGN